MCLRVALGIALMWFGFASRLMAADEPFDLWHQYTPNSPFFTTGTETLHGAGLVQSNGRYALLILAPEGNGAVVKVNLTYGPTPQSMTSSLVMPAGNVLTRNVQDAALKLEPGAITGSFDYTFPIAPQDIELFMAARTWRLNVDGEETQISLKGSRKAITAALKARRTGLRHTVSAEPPTLPEVATAD